MDIIQEPIIKKINNMADNTAEVNEALAAEKKKKMIKTALIVVVVALLAWFIYKKFMK